MSQPINTFDPDPNTGIIAWFARNSVAANLLMVFIILAGLAVSITTIRKQMFPQLEFNSISISAVYPGAAPKDVEESITLRIEEALEDIQGLDRVITYSRRNSFSSYIAIDEEYDLQEVMDEIKVKIDGIVSFPDGMERPIITANKYRQEVMYLALHGDIDQKTLKDFGEEIYREIQALSIVNVSEYYGGPKYEIAIEISKDKLREYNLSFDEVARAIRNRSANFSAGQIRAQDGYITVRSEQQAYKGNEFAQIVVKSLPDGSTITIADISTINDGFEEGISYSKFNGENSVSLFIGASATQSITDISDAVKQYVEDKNETLPAGVTLEGWVDMTYYLKGRLNMMIENMAYGGILVLLLLSIFLKIRLAFWVMLGLPIAFFGTLMLMPLPLFNVTINVASLFGFIMVLGIVVDDAIVIGESVNDEIDKHGHSVDNVIKGAKRVAIPVTFGVLTTIAAFSPFLLATGPNAAMPKAIGTVVVLCLIFSLIESKLILPAHLAGMKDKKSHSPNKINRFRETADKGMKWVIDAQYRPVLIKAIEYRYFVLTLFLVIGLICAGLFKGGIIRNIGFPKVPHDFPRILLSMEDTASEQLTLENVKKIEHVLRRVDADLSEEYGTPMIDDLSVSLRGRTEAEITAKLIDPELRPIDTFELARLWRNAMPVLPGKKALTIQDQLSGIRREDGDIAFKFASRNQQELSNAISSVRVKLESLKGVGDVNDSRDTHTQEVQFELKPIAYSMGFTPAQVASQMSFSLYGLEAQRVLRNGEEIKVMLRYPEHERNSIGQVDSILIRSPMGIETPLSEIADLKITPGVNQIRREDGAQTINLWASINKSITSPMEIYQEMNTAIIPKVLEQYPTVSSKVTGHIKRDMEANNDLLRDTIITLLVIYILLAIPLRSYGQPIIIMSVIPFGIMGAIIGHLILGMDMSSLSTFGIIAASGVVINDSLVMVDYINKARAQGVETIDAVKNAGTRRFRAIVLTSLTTFIGLVPIILETSLQAQIVIPMAVSLAFGVLFATVVTLFLVPCLYVIGKDIKNFILIRIIPLVHILIQRTISHFS